MNQASRLQLLPSCFTMVNGSIKAEIGDFGRDFVDI